MAKDGTQRRESGCLMFLAERAKAPRDISEMILQPKSSERISAQRCWSFAAGTWRPRLTPDRVALPLDATWPNPFLGLAVRGSSASRVMAVGDGHSGEFCLAARLDFDVRGLDSGPPSFYLGLVVGAERFSGLLVAWWNNLAQFC